MKKMILGLTAVAFACFAVPAFAEDAPAGDTATKAEKTPKKHTKKGKDAAGSDTGAAAAPGTDTTKAPAKAPKGDAPTKAPK